MGPSLSVRIGIVVASEWFASPFKAVALTASLCVFAVESLFVDIGGQA